MNKKYKLNKKIENVLNEFIEKVNKEYNHNFTNNDYSYVIHKNKIDIYLKFNLFNFKDKSLEEKLGTINKRYKFKINGHNDYKRVVIREYRDKLKKLKRKYKYNKELLEEKIELLTEIYIYETYDYL